LAIESGFQTRKPRKITHLELLHIYCLESIGKAPSHNDIAGVLGDSTGDAPSRQAVGKRTNEKFTAFLKMVLERTMNHEILAKLSEEANTCFPRIIVQDSTVLKLPIRLFDEFSGVSNAHAAVCNARIQGVYDLMDKRFLSFTIDRYSKNDRAAAPELAIREGDLVLRDRGYQGHAEIKRIQNGGAFYVCRHISAMVYRNPETDEKIDLQNLLKKNGHIDMDVCLNDDDRTPTRIVTARVDEETANRRRMKAKKEIRGHKPSENVLFLMSWTIYITNLPRNKFSFKKLFALYGLRWRIENIFKTWKSNMSFAAIHNVSANQLRAMLTARLITIVITMHCVYYRCAPIIAVNSDKRLSMAKLMRYIQVRSERLTEILSALVRNAKKVAISLIKFCSYDKRKRLNYVQNEEIVLKEISLS
jgi:hypothetical protein